MLDGTFVAHHVCHFNAGRRNSQQRAEALSCLLGPVLTLQLAAVFDRARRLVEPELTSGISPPLVVTAASCFWLLHWPVRDVEALSSHTRTVSAGLVSGPDRSAPCGAARVAQGVCVMWRRDLVELLAVTRLAARED